jgi:hypothetical protein
MFMQSLLGVLYKLHLGSRLLKGVGALVLGGSTLWWVIDEAGPADSTVLVHVTEVDVEVAVGDQTFPITGRAWAPIECRLRPGRHLLRMTRDDRVLYEEWFTVLRGEDVILTAYCPRQD